MCSWAARLVDRFRSIPSKAAQACPCCSPQYRRRLLGLTRAGRLARLAATVASFAVANHPLLLSSCLARRLPGRARADHLMRDAATPPSLAVAVRTLLCRHQWHGWRRPVAQWACSCWLPRALPPHTRAHLHDARRSSLRASLPPPLPMLECSVIVMDAWGRSCLPPRA